MSLAASTPRRATYGGDQSAGTLKSGSAGGNDLWSELAPHPRRSRIFPRAVWASHRGSVSRFFAKDGVPESGLPLANGRHSATTQGSPMIARKRDNRAHDA